MAGENGGKRKGGRKWRERGRAGENGGNEEGREKMTGMRKGGRKWRENKAGRIGDGKYTAIRHIFERGENACSGWGGRSRKELIDFGQADRPDRRSQSRPGLHPGRASGRLPYRLRRRRRIARRLAPSRLELLGFTQAEGVLFLQLFQIAYYFTKTIKKCIILKN